MEPADLSLIQPSPRRQLQGPRPTPLKVSKDSHKIKKQPPRPQPPQHRRPVIIYTVSPKVIHANRSEFMSLVQRLTGASSSSASSSADHAPAVSPNSRKNINSLGGAPSPAARLAVFERTTSTSMSQPAAPVGELGRVAKSNQLDVLEQLGIDGAAVTSSRIGLFPAGILSPVPSSLPSVHPDLFSSSTVQQQQQLQLQLNFFNELSPSFRYGGNKNFNVESTFLQSPNNFLSSTPIVPSPGACWDLFNQSQDF